MIVNEAFLKVGKKYLVEIPLGFEPARQIWDGVYYQK